MEPLKRIGDVTIERLTTEKKPTKDELATMNFDSDSDSENLSSDEDLQSEEPEPLISDKLNFPLNSSTPVSALTTLQSSSAAAKRKNEFDIEASCSKKTKTKYDDHTNDSDSELMSIDSALSKSVTVTGSNSSELELENKSDTISQTRVHSDNEDSEYDSEVESDLDEPPTKLESAVNVIDPEKSDFIDKLTSELGESSSQKSDDTKLDNSEYDYDITEKLKEMGEISVETVKKGEKPRKSETEGDAENEISVTPAKKDGNCSDSELKSDAERKTGMLRRNIREVMDETQLDEATLAAQRQEMERLRRVQEQQKIIREVQRQIALNRQNNRTQHRVISLLQGNSSIIKQIPGTSASGSAAGVSTMAGSLSGTAGSSGTPSRIGGTVLVKLPNGETKPMTRITKGGTPFEVVRLQKGAMQGKMPRNLIPIKKTSGGNLTPSVSIAPVAKKIEPKIESESESEEESDMEKKIRKEAGKPKDVVTISSSSDDDCIVLSEEEPDEPEPEEDPCNSGMHTNDAYNIPDEQGRVLINVGHPENEADIFLAPQIARIIKPHQIGGVRFLFDNVIESLDRFNTSTGFGCILAHSMGLGKTLQVVCFSDIFLRHTSAQTILCIMPINTLQNWLAEYNMWLPKDSNSSPLLSHGEVRERNFNLHVLNDSHKTLASRAKVIQDWHKEGGVLLIGYELYRLLSLRRNPKSKSKRKKPAGANEEEKEDDEKNKTLFEEIHEALVKPGPDLVICDEGHRIKNSHASISQALKQIRSKRRIVLTGYPLQNNLLEYWCMVDFVRPNYLGTKTEFSNMFERPIQNGQCIDSTPQDIRLMRYRAHVLHSLLEGFVQRRSHAVLQTSLPQKEEYVLLVRMTEFQRKLYDTFMNEVVRTKTVPNPLKAFAVCCKIWNHPDVLYYFLKKHTSGEAVDLDLEEVAGGTGTASTPSTPATPKKGSSRSKGGSKKEKKTVASKSSNANTSSSNNSKPAASITPNTNVTTTTLSTTTTASTTSNQSDQSQSNSSSSTMPNNNNAPNENISEMQNPPPTFNPMNTNYTTPPYPNPHLPYPQQPNYHPQYPQNGDYYNQNSNYPNNYNPGGYYQNQEYGGFYDGNKQQQQQQQQEGGFMHSYQQDGQNYWQSNQPQQQQNNQYYNQNGPQNEYYGSNMNQQPGYANQDYYRQGHYNQNYPQNNMYHQGGGNNAYPPNNQQWPQQQQNQQPSQQSQMQTGQPQQNLQTGLPPGQQQQQQHMQPGAQPPQNISSGQFMQSGQNMQPTPNQQNMQPGTNQQQHIQTGAQPQSQNMQTSQLMQLGLNQQNMQSGQPQHMQSGPNQQNMQSGQPQHMQSGPNQQNIHPGGPQQHIQPGPPHQHQQNMQPGPNQQHMQPGSNFGSQNLHPNMPHMQMGQQPHHMQFAPHMQQQSDFPKQELKPDLKQEFPNADFKSHGFKSEFKSEMTTENKNLISSEGGMEMEGENKLKSDAVDDEKKLENLSGEQSGNKDESDEKIADVDIKGAEMTAAAMTKANVKEDPGIPYDWAQELMKGYVPGCIENSAKMEIFFCILQESMALGDRILLFSQSLFTLNLIEEFLQRSDVPGTTDKWAKNKHYYRLDGSTSALEREKLINEYNSNPNIHLFLVSTRAGSLGINLVGANRVIVFDASWNPCHDTQAVCRVYRYGQKKPCFVYRVVMDNCLEKKIYDRQINKQGMSDRVVDECNPDAHLSMKDVTNLCWDDEKDTEVKDFSTTKDKYIDVVMQKVLDAYSSRLSKEPFQHESLLIDRKEKKLSQAEKRLAKRSYELEKQANINSRPTYSYYNSGTGQGLQIRAIRSQDGSLVGNKPVASVRPMQSESNLVRDLGRPGAAGQGRSRWIPAEVWQRQGMTAQEMTLPLDVVIPTNSPDRGSIVLKAGQKVLVLKSPKGIYMQLECGKIVAIKTAFKVRGGKAPEKGEEAANKDATPATILKKVPPGANTSKTATGNVPLPLKNNTAITVIPKGGQQRVVKPFTQSVTKLNMRSIRQPVPNLIGRQVPMRVGGPRFTGKIQSIHRKVQLAKAKPYNLDKTGDSPKPIDPSMIKSEPVDTPEHESHVVPSSDEEIPSESQGEPSDKKDDESSDLLECQDSENYSGNDMYSESEKSMETCSDMERLSNAEYSEGNADRRPSTDSYQSSEKLSSSDSFVNLDQFSNSEKYPNQEQQYHHSPDKYTTTEVNKYSALERFSNTVPDKYPNPMNEKYPNQMNSMSEQYNVNTMPEKYSNPLDEKYSPNMSEKYPLSNPDPEKYSPQLLPEKYPPQAISEKYSPNPMPEKYPSTNPEVYSVDKFQQSNYSNPNMPEKYPINEQYQNASSAPVNKYPTANPPIVNYSNNPTNIDRYPMDNYQNLDKSKPPALTPLSKDIPSSDNKSIAQIAANSNSMPVPVVPVQGPGPVPVAIPPINEKPKITPIFPNSSIPHPTPTPAITHEQANTNRSLKNYRHNFASQKAAHHNLMASKLPAKTSTTTSSALHQLEQTTSSIGENKQPFQESLDNITNSYGANLPPNEQKHGQDGNVIDLESDKTDTEIVDRTGKHSSKSPVASNEPSKPISHSSTSVKPDMGPSSQMHPPPIQQPQQQQPPQHQEFGAPGYSGYYGYNASHMQPYPPPPPPQGYYNPTEMPHYSDPKTKPPEKPTAAASSVATSQQPSGPQTGPQQSTRSEPPPSSSETNTVTPPAVAAPAVTAASVLPPAPPPTTTHSAYGPSPPTSSAGSSTAPAPPPPVAGATAPPGSFTPYGQPTVPPPTMPPPPPPPPHHAAYDMMGYSQQSQYSANYPGLPYSNQPNYGQPPYHQPGATPPTTGAPYEQGAYPPPPPNMYSAFHRPDVHQYPSDPYAQPHYAMRNTYPPPPPQYAYPPGHPGTPGYAPAPPYDYQYNASGFGPPPPAFVSPYAGLPNNNAVP